jgi:AraC-like DNA-binding protein
LYGAAAAPGLAKIAVGPVPVAPGGFHPRPLAAGSGWSVSDVVCTRGPSDAVFEERADEVSVALVLSGTFEYETPHGRALMTPGSLLLGNAGDCFVCGHAHGVGDRCLSFRFLPAFFDEVANAAGAPGAWRGFRAPRLPPLRELSGLVARLTAAVDGASGPAWEELAVAIAGDVVQAAARVRPPALRLPGAAEARVARVVRAIDRAPDAPHSLLSSAGRARLSPYHFLRTFEGVTGLTPHQYVRRARLRAAAARLLARPADRVIDVAFACGFGDVSNFNRAFRAEFGRSPERYRSSAARTRIVAASI